MFEIEWTLTTVLLFVGTGALAGLVDSIAGGGGLISLPVLLSTGMPPHLALGTNKLQSVFGTFTSTFNFFRKGIINDSVVYIGVVCTFIGASLGTLTIQFISNEILSKVIPFFLIIILVYSMFSKKLESQQNQAKISLKSGFILFGFVIGFYDGFFGPGTGSFWAIGLVSLAGMNLVRATGFTKVMNFTSNFAAVIFFSFQGNVLIAVALCMAVGQILGAFVGSSLAIQKGAKFIKPIFLLVVLATLLRLIYVNVLQ